MRLTRAINCTAPPRHRFPKQGRIAHWLLCVARIGMLVGPAMRLFAVSLVASMASGLLMRPVVTQRGGDSVRMQYSGYDQQQQYTYQQQGDEWAVPSYEQEGQYSAPAGYGAQVRWRIDATVGVAAMPQTSFPALPKCHVLPYYVRNGEDQVLSRCNMLFKTETVERVQCMIKALADGTTNVIGCGGKGPTLVRSRGDGQWTPLYKGQTRILRDGDQISLDAYNPESAVFTCTEEGAAQQGGAQGGAQGLPAGWYASVDPASGQTFYCNEQTGESQWEPPQQGSYY